MIGMMKSFLLICLIQEPTLDERIAEIVRKKFPEAPEGIRKEYVERLLPLFRRRPALVDRLDTVIEHTRSFCHFYDLKAGGRQDFPAMPGELKERDYDLSLRYVETTFQKAIESKPLDAATQQAIIQQKEWLLNEAKAILLSRIVGDEAHRAVEYNLELVRMNLGNFEDPVSGGWPRVLSEAESYAILDRIRAKVTDLKRDLENVTAPADSSAVSEDWKSFLGIMDEAMKALWSIADLWSPELAPITREYHKLKSEAEQWMNASMANWGGSDPFNPTEKEMNPKHIEHGKRGSTTANNAADPFDSSKEEFSPKDKSVPPSPPRRTWVWIAAGLFIALLAVQTARRLFRSEPT